MAAFWFLRRRYGKGVVCAAGLDTEIEMLEISGTLSDSSPRLFCSATNTRQNGKLLDVFLLNQ